MKTKNIFKTLALAMLMPTMLLTTACSSEDDLVNNTAGESTASTKGYPFPVTVNVSREGDAATRATYNESTKKLSFSAGDKLLVNGNHASVGQFAGTLTWQSGGTFSGTIYTENEYTGTAEALLAGADDLMATLLPAGYDTYGYLSIKNEGSYGAYLSRAHNKAFALTKKAAVEQFSVEHTISYSSGFALAPDNAILSFTISGLTANKEVAVSFNREGTGTISGNVTTSATGVATFAVGVHEYCELENCTLTVDGNPITLVSSSKTVAAGKIYNITRGTGATVDLSTKNADYTAQNGETLTGTLASNVKISIADGATVILKNVNITNLGNNCNWAGINCPGDATLVLEGTNTVCAGRDGSGYNNYPGIWIAPNKTLTILGNGTLTAYSNGTNPFGAGIGGGYDIACGNIVINSGNITATGGQDAAGIGGGNTSCGNITINGGTITATGGGGGAGIGGGYYASCGNITISGGTVSATGGDCAAGIGGGINNGACGTITITSGVTSVTATKGEYGPNSIGSGDGGAVITVTIGGTEYASGISQSPYEYSAPPTLTLTSPTVGQVIGSDGKNYAADASLPTGVTKVAMIAYLGNASDCTNGLAIALADEGSLNWATAKSTCEAKTPAFTNVTWRLPSEKDWQYMFIGCGSSESYSAPIPGTSKSYSGLASKLTTAQGDALQTTYYWSSTEKDLGYDDAWYVIFDGSNAEFNDDDENYEYQVRACLAF